MKLKALWFLLKNQTNSSEVFFTSKQFNIYDQKISFMLSCHLFKGFTVNMSSQISQKKQWHSNIQTREFVFLHGDVPIKCLPLLIMLNKVAVKWMLTISSLSFAESFVVFSLWLFYWQSRCVISNIMQVTNHQIGYNLFYNKYYMHTVHLLIVLKQTTLLGLLRYNRAHIILLKNYTKRFYNYPYQNFSVKMPFVNKNNVCIEPL